MRSRWTALAAGYAEAGQFAEAVQTARRAADLAAQEQRPALAESIGARIGLYEGPEGFPRGTVLVRPDLDEPFVTRARGGLYLFSAR